MSKQETKPAITIRSEFTGGSVSDYRYAPKWAQVAIIPLYRRFLCHRATLALVIGAGMYQYYSAPPSLVSFLVALPTFTILGLCIESARKEWLEEVLSDDADERKSRRI